MKSIQLEQDVAGHDEFRLAVTTRSIRGERIVTCHVRMNDVDLFSSHKLFQFACTLHVERVSQWQGEDLLG